MKRLKQTLYRLNLLPSYLALGAILIALLTSPGIYILVTLHYILVAAIIPAGLITVIRAKLRHERLHEIYLFNLLLVVGAALYLWGLTQFMSGYRF